MNKTLLTCKAAWYVVNGKASEVFDPPSSSSRFGSYGHKIDPCSFLTEQNCTAVAADALGEIYPQETAAELDARRDSLRNRMVGKTLLAVMLDMFGTADGANFATYLANWRDAHGDDKARAEPIACRVVRLEQRQNTDRHAADMLDKLISTFKADGRLFYLLGRKNQFGENALHTAASLGSLECAAVLAATGREFVRLANHASHCGQPRPPACQPKHANHCGNLPIHSVFFPRTSRSRDFSKCLDILKIILKEHPQALNQRNARGCSALHLATILHKDHPSALEFLLIQPSIDVHTRDNRGRTPLHYAALCNDSVALSRLIQAGADICSLDCEGRSPLHLAALENCLSTVNALVKHGAPIGLADRHRATPLTLSRADSQVRKTLVMEGERLLREEESSESSDGSGHRIRNLVFKGGGAKVPLHAGALLALGKYSDMPDIPFSLDDIERVGGASAGVFPSFLMAIGLTPEEIHQEMEKNISARLYDLDSSTHSDVKAALKRIAAKAEECSQNGEELPILKLLGYIGRPDLWPHVAPRIRRANVDRRFKRTEPRGLFPATYVREWANRMLRDRGLPPDLTFGELRELVSSNNGGKRKYRDLFVIVTDTQADTPKSVTVSHKTHKDISIPDALRASMAIPVLFKGHPLRTVVPNDGKGSRVKDRGRRGLDWQCITGNASQNANSTTPTYTLQHTDSVFYEDGGILRNYPIDLFDHTDYLPPQNRGLKGAVTNPETLGLRIVSTKDWRKISGVPDDPKTSAKLKEEQKRDRKLFVSILDVVAPYLKGYLDAESVREASELERSVILRNPGIGTVELKLGPLKLEETKTWALRGVTEYFDRSKLRLLQITQGFPTLTQNQIDIITRYAVDTVIEKNSRHTLLKEARLKSRSNPTFLYELLRTADQTGDGHSLVDPQKVAHLVNFLQLDVNGCDHNGKTALHLAIENGVYSVIHCLLNTLRVDPNCSSGRDHAIRSPLEACWLMPNSNSELKKRIMVDLCRAGACMCSNQQSYDQIIDYLRRECQSAPEGIIKKLESARDRAYTEDWDNADIHATVHSTVPATATTTTTTTTTTQPSTGQANSSSIPASTAAAATVTTTTTTVD